MTMDDQRKSAVFLGKMAERAEHYRETLEAIKSALELTEEERVLISVAYKNVFASGLATLRILASIEVQELSNGNHHNVRQIRDYTAKVEAVLTQIHQDLNSVLTDHVNMIGDAYKNHRFLFGSYVMDSKQLKMVCHICQELEVCACGDDGNRFTLNTEIIINESLDRPLSEICTSIDQKFKTACANAINSMTNDWMSKEQANLERLVEHQPNPYEQVLLDAVQQPVINHIVEQQVVFEQGGRVYSDAEIDLLIQGVISYGRNFVTIKNQLFSNSIRSVGGLKKKWYALVKAANQQSSSGLPLTAQMSKVLVADQRCGGGGQ